MAVELRCPDCRAKLRLPEDPEPGTEVECPECNAIFNAPDPDTGEVPDARPKKKAKKKAADDGDGGDKPKKEKEKKAGDKKPGDKKQPKKRRAKKKETNKGAMIAVIAAGLLFLAVMIGLLVWFFTRKPASYEMMTYLPADAIEAVGLNTGHMHKYTEFVKVVEPGYKDTGFQKAVDALATALKLDAFDVPDYMVQGSGKSGEAMVIRTKKPIDPDDLKNLPGAQKGSLDGMTYYRISPIPKLFGGGGARVFAPTNRIVVFASDIVTDSTLRNMMTGNKGDPDATLAGRVGPLGKRVSRGTFWYILVFDSGNRPKKEEKGSGGNASEGNPFQAQVVSNTETAKGFGFKASLGSRSVRFEVALWVSDAEAAKERYNKYFGKGSDIVAAQDDASKDPPKWWKAFEQQLGGKKIGAEMFQNFGATSSGDLFIIYTECDTKILMDGVSGMVQKFIGKNQDTTGPGMMPPPAGGQPPPMGPGGAAVPPL